MSALVSQPDWGVAVSETLQWGASRVRSRNGLAERVELVAPWPVRIVQMSAWAGVASDRASLELGPDEHLIPWLPGRTRVIDVVSTTEYDLEGDPFVRGFRAGGAALLSFPDGTTEVVSVSVLTTNLFLSDAAVTTPVLGTTITPLLRAVLEADAVAIARRSPSVGTATYSWRCVDTRHDGADDAADEDWTISLDDVDVMARIAEASEMHEAGSERLVGLGGAWRRIVPGAGVTAVTQRHVLLSAAEVLDLRRWLYRRRGPLTPCWVPTGMSLGRIGVEVFEALNVLEVDDPGTDEVDALRQAVIVWPRVGPPTAHAVGTILRYGEETVPEGRAWLAGLSPALTETDILGAQWLVHSRLDDTVTIQWLSSEAAAVTLQWMSTPVEVAE